MAYRNPFAEPTVEKIKLELSMRGYSETEIVKNNLPDVQEKFYLKTFLHMYRFFDKINEVKREKTLRQQANLPVESGAVVDAISNYAKTNNLNSNFLKELFFNGSISDDGDTITIENPTDTIFDELDINGHTISFMNTNRKGQVYWECDTHNSFDKFTGLPTTLVFTKHPTARWTESGKNFVGYEVILSVEMD